MTNKVIYEGSDGKNVIRVVWNDEWEPEVPVQVYVAYKDHGAGNASFKPETILAVAAAVAAEMPVTE